MASCRAQRTVQPTRYTGWRPTHDSCPGDAGAHEADRSHAQIHGECIGGAQPGDFHELHGVADEEDVTGEGLHVVGHDADDQSAEVRAAETFQVVGSVRMVFEICFQSECLLDVHQFESNIDLRCV